VSEYDLEIKLLDIAKVLAFTEHDSLWERREFNDCTIIVFSVVEPETYKAITEIVISKLSKIYSILGPVIPVGCQTNLRSNHQVFNYLIERELQPITFEMGEQFACKINATKYIECSSSDEIWKLH